MSLAHILEFKLDWQLQRLRDRISAMAVLVREASLTDDQHLLIGLARTYLNGDADGGRFRWLYQENPFGPARAWIACGKNGDAAGMAAVFPRQMYCDGVAVSGCVLGDFCTSTKYRSLGPALQLQRACLACARSGEFALAYDFPSATMVGIYERLGIRPAGKSVRWVKVLRVDNKIELILPIRTVSRPVAAILNGALALRDHKMSGPPGVNFHLEEALCTSEYSELAERVGSSLGICTVRSAEYLNWRYRQHPYLNYEFFTVRRGKELLAYCTFTVAGGNATIAELFGNMNDDDLVSGLLQELAVLLRTRGVATLSVPLLGDDPRNRLLSKLGFWAREAVPVMGFGRESTIPSSRMFLMHGDRES
jgi:GNAT acetyltransferase-like protein